MSYSAHTRINVGAYDQPFSGVGIEFFPLGTPPGRSGVTLHESGYLPKNRDWNYPRTFSPFWRLYYNAHRGHCVVFGERMIELTPDHIMLIPDHCLFHCLGLQPVPTLWLTFSLTRTLHHALPVPVLLLPRNTELCLITDLSKLIEDNETWEPSDAIYRISLALLHVILARSELHWQPPVPDKLTALTAYIEAHLTDRLSNPQLAACAGMSVTGFERAFKRYFGVTPAVYVTKMRIRAAILQLLHSPSSIDAIADATGFPNRAYFSRVFKKITGKTPAGFRDNHRPAE